MPTGSQSFAICHYNYKMHTIRGANASTAKHDHLTRPLFTYRAFAELRWIHAVVTSAKTEPPQF